MTMLSTNNLVTNFATKCHTNIYHTQLSHYSQTCHYEYTRKEGGPMKYSLSANYLLVTYSNRIPINKFLTYFKVSNTRDN